MAVLMSLNGNTSGDGFLLTPLFSTYDAEISLWTDTGTASVTLQASPNPAGLVFSQTALNLSTIPTAIQVHATLQSGSRGDTTIEVLQGTTVVVSFTVTSISKPIIHFRGRFEARFATDNLFYNRNPMYTSTVDTIPGGWTWGLEGEPNFVPTTNNVPENLEDTGKGRVIRLNNPIALRTHAAPVVSAVHSISGETVGGPETFLAGDPLIGQPANFGPDTYFAGNNPRDPSDPQPEEFFGAAVEPLALFELHFGSMFSGASEVGPFVAKSTTTNFKTRTPDSRPIANGLVGAASERAEFGLPSLQAFSETRIDLLVADYNALPPGPSQQRRNLARRIGHLLSSVSLSKRGAVLSANPGAFTVRTGTLTAGWEKEVYGGLPDSHTFNDGRVNTNLVFNPTGSSVIEYISQFTAFNIVWEPFAFHSDELCGHHKGLLTHLNADGTYAGDPHTRTLDGTLFDFQAVGEFTLLQGSGLEIQVRQTPVLTANPFADSYSELKVCVSLITAAAACVGKHRISFQPIERNSRLQFYVNGKPTDLTTEGLDLDSHRVSGFDANGETGIRIDYSDGTVVLFTPMFWNAHNMAYINVSVVNTKAHAGIMGYIPKGSWLPRLRNGQALGPKPPNLADRYQDLYKTFADSWRVTNNSSLFVYNQGTTTETFTDRNWPAGEPPCELKPQFEVPGTPVHQSITKAEAEVFCQKVTDPDLNAFCIFDVGTTGDKDFAEGYLFLQELRKCGTSVFIQGNEPPILPERKQQESDDVKPKIPPKNSIVVTTRVAPLMEGGDAPIGQVTFFVNGEPNGTPVKLDELGQARKTISGLSVGEHKIRVKYNPGKESKCQPSSSPNLIFTVDKEDIVIPPSKDRKWPWWLIILFLLLIILFIVFIF